MFIMLFVVVIDGRAAEFVFIFKGESVMEEELSEGGTYELKIDAKSPRGEGIGKINNFVIFIKNAKTRIGKIYKVKITKRYRTFAYAEPIDTSKYFIGNGSLII